MKSKLIENAGYISIALVLALTLVLSFSAVDFNLGLIAHAEEEPSENGIFIYPGSTSILAPGYDPFAAEIYFQDSTGEHFYSISADVTVDQSFVSNPSSLLQFIFYADISGDGDLHYFFTSFAIPSSLFATASDLRFDDRFFVFGFNLGEDIEGDFVIYLDFHQFVDDFTFSDFTRIYVYDVRMINSQSSDNNSTADSFLSIVGDGISFGFESIADGITYTVENLYFTEEGTLSDFSIIIFCLTGVSLALAVVKYILRIIFSFGGVKL